MDEFDDDELLELAQTQMSKPKDMLSGATSAKQQLSVHTQPVAAPIFSSTQEALQEEQEIAELVRLANTTVPLHDHAAGEQQDLEDMPESSTAAAERMQEASTSYSMPTEAPSWSGANIRGASMPITLQDGRRAFCRLHEQPSTSPAHTFLKRSKLLSAPITSMMQDVEQEAFAKALQDSQLLQAKLHETSPMQQPAASTPPAHEVHKKMLWVDKYSPRSFFDLLSDDQINREVVRWVKSWESVVHQKQTANNANPGAHVQQGPEQKLLLLSGPPGEASHIVPQHHKT